MSDTGDNCQRRGGLAEAYARFRGGRAFLIVLAAIVFFWIGWNAIPGLPHFDGGGFGRLNLVLSVEASLSVALLIMANEKSEAERREQIVHLCRVSEMTEKLTESLKQHIERTETMVESVAKESKPNV